MKRKILVIGILVTVSILGVVGYLFFQKSDVESKGKKLLTFSMEDDLKSIPAGMRADLEQHEDAKEYLLEGCTAFVGRKLDIVPKDKDAEAWIATTSSACGWGAHSAPIWMILKNGKTNSIVLSTGGIGVSVYEARWYGMRDVVVSNSAAAYYTDQHFRFDGKKYNEISSRYIEADDPDACRKAPDVFSCN